MLRTAFSRAAVRSFHTSRPVAIKAGEQFPDVTVFENSVANKLSLASELKNHKKALVIGVPGAFSPGCSNSHIPSYVKAKSGIPTYVVAVNDAFVTKAWGEALVQDKDAGFRFISDPAAALTNALELGYDSADVWGTPRSKRYVLYTENGVVKKVFEEPDNTGVKVTLAENVLPQL